MTNEWLLLFLSVLFTLMVARYLLEGVIRMYRGQSPAVLVLGLLGLPVQYVVWHRWAPWRGVSSDDIMTAVAAAVVVTVVHVLSGAVEARSARRRAEQMVAHHEAAAGATVSVVTFPQAPESQYLRIESTETAQTRVGWVPPRADRPDAQQWDATLARMGFQRATPWTPGADGAPACEAILPLAGTPQHSD